MSDPVARTFISLLTLIGCAAAYGQAPARNADRWLRCTAARVLPQPEALFDARDAFLLSVLHFFSKGVNVGLQCVVRLNRSNLIEVAHAFVGERDLGLLIEDLTRRLERSGSDALEIDLAEILHPFIRAMVNRYSGRKGPNCFAAAIGVNSGYAPPTGYLTDIAFERKLRASYRSVDPAEALRTGDVLVYYPLVGGPEYPGIVHASTYVSESMVFTKNGMSNLSAYIFEHRAKNEAYYFPRGGFRVAALRVPADPRDVIAKSGHPARPLALYETRLAQTVKRGACAGKLRR